MAAPNRLPQIELHSTDNYREQDLYTFLKITCRTGADKLEGVHVKSASQSCHHIAHDESDQLGTLGRDSKTSRHNLIPSRAEGWPRPPSRLVETA